MLDGQRLAEGELETEGPLLVTIVRTERRLVAQIDHAHIQAELGAYTRDRSRPGSKRKEIKHRVQSKPNWLVVSMGHLAVG